MNETKRKWLVEVSHQFRARCLSNHNSGEALDQDTSGHFTMNATFRSLFWLRTYQVQTKEVEDLSGVIFLQDLLQGILDEAREGLRRVLQSIPHEVVQGGSLRRVAHQGARLTSPCRRWQNTGGCTRGEGRGESQEESTWRTRGGPRQHWWLLELLHHSLHSWCVSAEKA